MNWTPLFVFTLIAFALGCLAGIVVGERRSSGSVFAEPVASAATVSDARDGTEVEISENAIALAVPVATPEPSRAHAPAPPKPLNVAGGEGGPARSSTARREMVYAIPLLTPVPSSPANIEPTGDDSDTRPAETAPASAAAAAAAATSTAAPATPAPTPASASARAEARPAPLQPPQRIRRVAPEYPRFARINNVEGTVIIAATIDTEGKVTYPRVVKSFPLLDQAALDAVQQWQFKPGTRGGQPVPVDVTLSVGFSLR